MKGYIVKNLIHYCNVSFPTCKALPPKRVEYYDLTFVLSGSMEYIADGETYSMEKSDCLLLPPGTMRQRKAGNTPVHYVSFNFTALPDTPIHIGRYHKNCINADIKGLISVFAQNHISPHFHSREKCISILNYILFELMDMYPFQSQNIHIRRIIKFVDEHLTHTISLKDVSVFLGLTPEYTAALFKAETGKTLISYINEQKLLAARQLISESSLSLQQISEYFGYSSYNYFSRLFQQQFHTRPSNIERHA